MKDPNMIEYTHPETGRWHVETKNDDPSMTQQQFAADTDVNNIMKKYESTGEFTHRTQKGGMYADFSNISDYQTMLHTVMYAQEAFGSLPAAVRTRFRNDPGELLSYLQDPSNKEEAIKLGLIPIPQSTTTTISSNANDSNERELSITKKTKSKMPPTPSSSSSNKTPVHPEQE